MRPATKAIHAGTQPDASTGAVIPAIHLSTTFERDNEYIYSRAGNPNRANLETAIAALEDARYCLAYASGMAAINAVVGLLRPGDRILSISALYGGTMVYFNEILPTLGITVDYLDDLSATGDLDASLWPETKLVWLETPTNPTMQVTDIAALAKQCRRHGLLLAVDNTFSSPIISQPLVLGADMVIHSATKYLNGHADVTMGVLSLNSKEHHDLLRTRQSLNGATPSPFDCWLCHRGLKTLALRVRQASHSALRLAQFLESQPNVKVVNYPTLPSSPFHTISATQNQGGLGGGMLSFRVEGDAAAVCARAKLFKWAVSLGGVESLIEVPASALTHKNLPKEVRERIGVFEDLIRISVGCEDVEDLLEDLQQALEALN